MILIIGTSIDPVRPVVEEIRKMGQEVTLFRADQCLKEEYLNFQYSSGKLQATIDQGPDTIDLSCVTSVWFWKPVLPKELRVIEPESHRIFIYRQFLASWRALASVLADRKWLNNYYKMLEAEHKPIQLQFASMLGFEVPDTIITANPKRALEFWNKYKHEVIIKNLIASPIDDRVVFTNLVTNELMAQVDRLRSSPVILQRRIPSAYELRITVVGNTVFSARIDSCADVDWRRSKANITAFDLPLEIEQQCRDLVHALGLNYSCIDMIVTPENKYVFLELNPNGQWSFIQEATNLKIGEEIAKILTN